MSNNNKTTPKWLIWVAAFLAIIGLLIMGSFIFLMPFNDGSWVRDASLFSQYGEFICGFAGSLFSLAGFVLLYLNLRIQNEQVIAQKLISETDQFETTFFNLLNVQQNITNDIKAYFRNLSDISNPKSFTVKGREFFSIAIIEMKKIDQTFSSTEYLGEYSDKDSEYWENYVEDLFNPGNYFAEDPKEIESDVIKKRNLQLGNLFYGITKQKWMQGHNLKKKERIQYIYKLFFDKFHYVLGHYFRNIYHILKYVEQFENKQKGQITDISKLCYDYAQFIQSQMSSNELILLYYNALCYEKSLNLIKKYDFDEHIKKHKRLLIGQECYL